MQPSYTPERDIFSNMFSITGYDTLIHIFLICFPIFFHILRPSYTPDHDKLIHIILICFPIFFHILRPSYTPDHDTLIHIFLNVFSTSFSHLCGHLTHRTSTSSDAAARVFPHSQNDWRREVGTEKFLLLQI